MNWRLRADRPHQFRSMWTEFEWENRVNVTTSVTYAHSAFWPRFALMLRFLTGIHGNTLHM